MPTPTLAKRHKATSQREPRSPVRSPFEPRPNAVRPAHHRNPPAHRRNILRHQHLRRRCPMEFGFFFCWSTSHRQVTTDQVSDQLLEAYMTRESSELRRGGSRGSAAPRPWSRLSSGRVRVNRSGPAGGGEARKSLWDNDDGMCRRDTVVSKLAACYSDRPNRAGRLRADPVADPGGGNYGHYHGIRCIILSR